MVSHLLREPDFVHLHKLLHLGQANFLPFEVRFQLVRLGELVAHIVLHVGALLLRILHLIMDTSLQRLHLLKVVLYLLLLNLEASGRSLSIFHLVLLELQITSHFVNLLLSGQLVLSLHRLLHMLKQACNQCLAFLDLLLVLTLLLLELLGELVDFLFFLVQDLILLLFTLPAGTALFFEIIVNLLNVLLVLVHHLLHLKEVLVHLFELSVVLLDPILETLPCLREWQVHLIRLQLQILFLLHQGGPLIFQMLCSLLQGVLAKACFRLHETGVDLLQFISGVIDFLRKHIVLLLELFILVPLLRIEVVETGLILEVDVLDLLFITLDLRLHIPLVTEEIVQVSSLLIILILYVQVEILNVLWLGVTSVLVKSQIVVGKLTFVLSDILDEGLVLPFKGEVLRVVLVDVLDLLLHFADLTYDLIVLALQQVQIVVAIVDLPSRSLVLDLDSRHTVVGHWPIDCGDLGVVADTGEICLPLHCSGLPHGSAHSHSCLHALLRGRQSVCVHTLPLSLV